jgi:hypothetical protein
MRQAHELHKVDRPRSMENAARTGSRQFISSQRSRHCRAEENFILLDTKALI